MKSMTGFGRGQSQLGDGHVVVELRTLNHKYLDLRIHLAPELAHLEHEVDQQLRRHFSRGRIELTAKLRGCRAAGTGLDREAAKTLLLELESLRAELGLAQELPMQVLSAVPHLFLQSVAIEGEESKTSVVAAVGAAIEDADAMRDREGDALLRDFDQWLDHIGLLVTDIEALAVTNAQTVLERLRGRLHRLLDTDSAKLDENRLAQEAALLAERADVTEELTRLRSHTDQFRAISRETGPIGRRLDFLLQEMAREASTTGAKTQNAEMQHKIVDLRGDLNRIREQVQNIE